MNATDQAILHSGLSDAEIKRIKVVQILDYLAIIGNSLYAFGYLFIDVRLYLNTINLLVFTIPFYISIRLISLGKYNTAKVLLSYFSPLPIIIGSIFFMGKQAGCQFFLLLYAFVPLTIWTFKNKWHVSFLFFFNVLSFIFIQYYNIDQFSITKYPSKYILIHSVSCYITCILVIAYLIFWYQYTTDKFEILLREKSDNLVNINLQLVEQKEVVGKANRLLTERQKHIEEQSQTLAKINDELEEMVVTKDKFFSIIARDLKNPLSTLKEFSKLLYENRSQYDERQKIEISKMIYENSISTYSLLDNLLIWARMQTSGIKTNPERINLYDLIEETSRLFEYMRSKKNIALTLPADKSLEVFADRYMLSSVLNNLLSNALKFSRVGGTINISTEFAENEHIRVCISDNGIGISKENISRLFRIDQSFSTRGTNNEKGTGLGLLLCNEFVEKNGGRIWVESEPDKGSHFFFTIRKTYFE